jgi:hypothetical protein
MLRNAAGEAQITVPNHEFRPLAVAGDPLSTIMLFDRGSLTWQETVATPCYLYGVHASGTFVSPPTLAATMYLVSVFTARRRYGLAMRYAEACHVDTPFTPEERFMFCMLERTLDSSCPDNDPDAHAVRLRMSHCVLHSPNKTPWEVHIELAKYLSKEAHVSADCRLSTEEVLDLLKRCNIGHAIIKARLGVLQAAANGHDRVTLKRPASLTAGQPWARLVGLPSHTLDTNCTRITRIHYKEPAKPLKDGELVRFLFEDDLLMDEDSGSNRQLGFMFLYMVTKRRVPMALGNDDITANMAVLLTRYYHLKLARWGKEAQGQGETEALPAFSTLCLAAMHLNPHEHWPDMRDNRAMVLMSRGVNINGQEARETVLPQFWSELDRSIRNCHQGFLMPVARQQSLDAMSRASKLHEHHHPPRDGSVSIDRKALATAGRVLPSDTACDSLLVHLPTSEATKRHRECPLGAVAEGHTTTHVPSDAERSSREAEMRGPGGELLPFPHIEEHPGAQTPVGKDMLARLEGDMKTYVAMTAASNRSNLTALERPGAAEAVVREPSGDAARDLVEECRAIIAELAHIRTTDAVAIRDQTAYALKLANAVYVDGKCVSSADGSFDTEKQRKRATGSPALLRRHLLRLRRQTSQVTFEWLCGVCLSSHMDADMRRVNPFHGDLGAMRQAVAAVMLSSVRLYFAQQAIQHASSIITFIAMMHKAKQQRHTTADDVADAVGGSSDDDATQAAVTRMMLLVTQLVNVLTAKRFYAAPADVADDADIPADRSFLVDPRFLAFEFMFSILLRERQVQMVRWFVDNVNRGESRVQQMLMGQGKTTVVGPLLALILSTSTSLVTQVMPTALLEQSRAILRRCFAVVVPKQVYTLQFDRNVTDGDDAAIDLLVQKLEAAERHRAIVVAPPEAIKALLLKIVEQLHAVEDATAPSSDDRTVSTAAVLLGLQTDADAEDDDAARSAEAGSRAALEAQALRRRLVARSRMAELLTPILNLWRRGVLIMDEVDVLLHPLRSELNFPIGHKQPIDCSGPRWLLPIFVLDATFYAAEVCSAVRAGNDPTQVRVPSSISDQLPEHRQPLRGMATRALDGIVKCVAEGYHLRALQREPHIALLDVDFYKHHMMPAYAKLLEPWFINELETQTRAKAGLSPAQLMHVTKLTGRILMDSSITDLSAEASALFPPHMIQLLLLGRDWMQTLLPHVLSKINRVSFGLLQPHDFATLSAKTADGDEEALIRGMPISRRLLAVPFVAKDVPSRSSEFAHPDVVIGLTVLANRYEGLRLSDVRAMLAQLKQDYSRQSGRRELRPAAVTYNRWVELGSAARGDANASVVPLGQLQVLDPVQIKQMHALLRLLPEAVHYNLTQHVFPRTMAFQQLKVSACGHELGSSILFSRRIGFSGTPSNLLPLDLGDCSYEPGSDGRIVSALTSDAVTSAELLPADWSPVVLLHRVATANPPYHALIDTGALITNMDNRDVAAYLMTHLPEQFDAVVYLDSSDRQMALLRANRLTVPVTQCGVPLARRFTFFDQNHTTGTDVKQAQTAVAVVTIGKDMVFRDYAQGAYRMRGIGQGQRIHLYIIPEVHGRIRHVLGTRHYTGRPEIDVPAWLLLNGMRVEGLQSVKLAAQEIANVFRKRCLGHLLGDIAEYVAALGGRPGHDDIATAWRRCLRFRDPSETKAEGNVGSTAIVSDRRAQLLRYSVNEFREDIVFNVPSQIHPPMPYVEKVQREVHSKIYAAESVGSPLPPDAKHTIDTVLHRVADSVHAEHDQGADEGNLNSEVVHEQEAEEEQEQEAEQEEQRVSAFARDDEAPRPWPAAQLRLDPADVRPAGDAAFYPIARFRCRPQHRALSTLPRSLQMSDNSFRLSWCGVGDRRLKNIVVYLEWYALDRHATATETETANSPAKSAVQRPTQFFAVITLAEAESLRWLVHHSSAVNGNAAIAIRLLSTGEVMDASVLHQATASTTERTRDDVIDRADAQLFFRFLDNDMFFDDADLDRLERGALRFVPDRTARTAFFEECLRLRRRHRQQWDDTPIARLLLPAEDVAPPKSPGETAPAASGEAASSTPTGVLRAADVASRAAAHRMRAIFSRNEVKRRLATERLQSATTLLAKIQTDSTAADDANHAAGSVASDVALPVAMVSAILAPLLRPAFSQRDVASALSHGLPPDPAHPTGAVVTLRWLERSLFTAPPPKPVDVDDDDAVVDAPQATAGAQQQESAAAADDHEEWICQMCSGRNPWCIERCDFCESAKPKKGAGGAVLEPWDCQQCTYKNDADTRYCAMCNFDSGRVVGPAGGGDAAAQFGHMEVPEGYWVCSPEKGGCSKFNPNTLFYCEVCDRARPDLATLRF